MTITSMRMEPGFDAKTVGLSTSGGLVRLDDVIDLTTPKGRKIKGARIIRINPWSPIPFRVEFYADDGKLRKDAFNLDKCSWCISEDTRLKRRN